MENYKSLHAILLNNFAAISLHFTDQEFNFKTFHQFANPVLLYDALLFDYSEYCVRDKCRSLEYSHTLFTLMTRTSLRNQIAYRQWKTLNCQREQQINKKTFQNDNVAYFSTLHLYKLLG
ncbi:hypothetical protein T10_10681 [Trichinella papuae]|uniref:Uncharacterized protein n=1 Tax=Trichinella papuae TaxID=268474 RepID=A0A0V1MTU2_9BILA|nr:hypothetical protein T10_10681 [Trichinella papuae]